MKINLKKYLLYSSVFAIFTEAFYFNLIIDWKLFYLILLVNYLLIFTYYEKIIFTKNFIYFILFVFIHGLFCYTIIGIPFNYMLSQIIGITIIGIYYYNFIQLYKVEEIIAVYLKMALVISIIAYPMYFLGINFNANNDPRLSGILKEPAHYAIVIIPACYYFFKTKKYLSFFIVFGTLILSNSSLGYIGCGLLFLLPNLNRKRLSYLVIVMPFILISFIYIYNNYTFFKMRVDDTYENLKVINTGKFKEETNLSSYVMLANVYIMKENVKDHPFGSGIGSHHYMHTENYIKELRPPKYLVKQNIHTNNSFDANSLAIRMLSEFGVFGLLAILIAIIAGVLVFSSKELIFLQGLFIYICLKLFRDGHYFPPEFFFFLCIFYISYLNHFKKQTP
ncbi:O-antigen ligase family protein [Flavobacterium gelidilacus]|jgi:hypothetical protein|uniref:O-antigen ligase family protein n=1 Tax=Flavobacterium gelidilacus TaxID=206041 RepID=UPI0004072051|nr:O-antigen ligase family protein [Flavobacterium gelidilacus]